MLKEICQPEDTEYSIDVLRNNCQIGLILGTNLILFHTKEMHIYTYYVNFISVTSRATEFLGVSAATVSSIPAVCPGGGGFDSPHEDRLS